MAAEKPEVSDAAVRKATGRSWEAWVEALDGWGAEEASHKEIVALVRERGEVDGGWWQQTVTVGYEKLKGRRVVGETADTGFQIGVQRTVQVEGDRAWDLLISPEGLAAWLGERGGPEKLEKGERYRLRDGSEGEVRAVRPGERVRITWRPEGWERPSTIQARVEPKGDRAVIAFHEEHLPDAEERERRREHFRSALDRLQELAKRGDGA